MQIVVFKLGEEHFAVKTENVQSINDIMSITKVPKSPGYIKGLINLRGSIKSLIDINLLLKIDYINNQENIIILEIDEEEVGILVDIVEEVLDIENKNLKELKKENNENYVEGIITHKNKLITLINIKELLDRKI